MTGLSNGRFDMLFEEALERNVVRPSPDADNRYTFVTWELRDAVCQSVPGFELGRLHRRIAAVLDGDLRRTGE